MDARDLADELHDGPMQELTHARLQLDLLRRRQEAPGELEEIAEMLDAASEGLQRAVRALRAAGGAS